MTIYNPEGTHERYTSTDRHFSPVSERYTGADSLLTAQRNGWHMMSIVYEQIIELNGGRHTSLYHIKLVRDSDMMTMPVLSNPFVERMIANKRVHVVMHPLQAAEHRSVMEDSVETQVPQQHSVNR